MDDAREPEDETPSEPARHEEPGRPRVRIETYERALIVLLSVALFGSALAIGAVHTAVLVPVAIVATAAAMVAVPLRQLSTKNRAWPAPALIFMALSLFTVLQAVPLPVSVLKVIAPANADVWSRALLPFGEELAWGSISLDPGRSMVEALKWLMYAEIFFAASVLGARRGTQAVLALVTASATFVALVTLVHGLFGAQNVFGIYEPNASFAAHHVGPLLNANNLAGYVNLGALTGLGLMIARRPIVPVWVLLLAVAIDIGAAVRSASRGGVAALLIGVLMLSLLFRARGSKRTPLRRKAAPIILVSATVVFGGALALIGGDVWVWRELWNDNLSKLRIVSWCLPLLKEYGLFGVGRGAFESVFEAYRPVSGLHVVYTHPENFLAQWASEWGVIVAALALGALLWLYRPGSLGVRKSAVVAGGWVALFALSLQNLADLGLEIPAVAIGATVVLGALWSDPARRHRLSRSIVDRVSAKIGARPFALIVASLVLVFSGFSLAYGLHDVSRERNILRDSFEAATDDPAARPAFRSALRTAMARRPAEHYFSLLGAMAAFRWDDQKVMPWLKHTLERAPVNGRAHALLANVLATRGARKQALFELRLAVTYEPGLAEKTAPLAVRLAHNFDELLTAVPEGAPGAMVLNMMARELSTKDEAEMRHQADLEATSRDAKLIEPRVRLLAGLFADTERLTKGQEPQGACPTLSACAGEIERHAAAIQAQKPHSSLASVMRAKGLIARDLRPEAEALLEEGCAAPEDRASCLEVRAENLVHTGDVTKLEAVLKEVLSASCTTAQGCANAATFAGSIREKRGDLHGAAVAFMRAAQEDPTEERWLRAAKTAESAQMLAQAIEALSRVSVLRGGADPEINTHIAKLRAQVASDAIRRR